MLMSDSAKSLFVLLTTESLLMDTGLFAVCMRVALNPCRIWGARDTCKYTCTYNSAAPLNDKLLIVCVHLPCLHGLF